MKYDFTLIENKWQSRWYEEKIHAAQNGGEGKKSYLLVEFPYPSGDGLHVGHARPYTAMDAIARKRRMQGENVLFPIGYDAFGLPTENYAIKNHIQPRIVTEERIVTFRNQLKSLGYSFDWDREVDTTDPDYFKWTQWIFLQMFDKGLAYKARMPVNWCTSCKCVLANEEVVDNVCERCGSEVARREKSQWMLGITKYAQRLLDDLEELDFIERVKAQQRNWIGRSEGVEAKFTSTEGDEILVFTTRPDTLFGATYMVLSPEHKLVSKWLGKLENRAEIERYRAQAAAKSELERTELAKDKTGVRLEGVGAINPVTDREIPIFISDYVLSSYGTGAIMAVPGHDQRDWEFADKFGLPIIEVVQGGDVSREAYTDSESGIMVNSDFLNGMQVEEAKAAISGWLKERGLGEEKVNFKLRDWVFSRQRYWGEPIPIVHCETCGYVPLPESELPLLLPEVESYEPTDTGQSPLAALREWVETSCPKCGGKAERETDTMPQWAGSSWYFLRYMDAHNDKELASRQAMEYWSPVDWYNGGMEHTTLHLLYSRFWHKFLYDIGVVPTKEPYAKRTSHGMILGEDGDKMSKSRGNVVNPTDIIRQYGADTMRSYILFIGDFEKTAPWSSTAVKGCKRFLDKVWSLSQRLSSGDEYSQIHEALIHRTIKKVGDDLEQLKHNTAIAALMTLTNEFVDKGANRGEFKTLLQLLSPIAPHICDELWESLGFGGICSISRWPSYDEAKTREESLNFAVQINGKFRGTVTAPADSGQAEVLGLALADERLARHVPGGGEAVKKVIFVKNKLINLIVK